MSKSRKKRKLNNPVAKRVRTPQYKPQRVPNKRALVKSGYIKHVKPLG